MVSISHQPPPRAFVERSPTEALRSSPEQPTSNAVRDVYETRAVASVDSLPAAELIGTYRATSNDGPFRYLQISRNDEGLFVQGFVRSQDASSGQKLPGVREPVMATFWTQFDNINQGRTKTSEWYTDMVPWKKKVRSETSFQDGVLESRSREKDLSILGKSSKQTKVERLSLRGDELSFDRQVQNFGRVLPGVGWKPTKASGSEEGSKALHQTFRRVA